MAKEYISEMAEENMQTDLLFFVARKGDAVSESLKKFARLPETGSEPLLTIVDIPKRRVSTANRYY